jgi:heme exporter protein CcmD
MNTGVIQGGWEFVWAAYAVSATILAGYVVSVFARYRAALRRRAEAGAPVTP